MNQQGPLRWIVGTGWLVFSAASPESDVRSRALARANGEGVIAYVSFAADCGDALMDDMEDLGAPAGYLVDFAIDRGLALHKQLEHVSLLVIETGSSLDAVLAALTDEVVAALRRVYERGAVVLVEGLAMNAFGRWAMQDDGQVVDGLHWLENAFIDPAFDDGHSVVHDVLQAFDEAIGISVGEGSALVLGGDGTVEVWGRGNVRVSLGRYYSSQKG